MQAPHCVELVRNIGMCCLAIEGWFEKCIEIDRECHWALMHHGYLTNMQGQFL